MKKTSLYDEHVKLGAKIVDFAGWQMPIQYSGLKQEVLAVRNEAGMFDVSHMGEFLITGPDALKFIDYLVTNDIAGAKTGKAIYSPLCNNEGKILDDLIVYKLSTDKIFVCVNAANIGKDFNWMQAQAKDFNVEFTNLSEQYSLIALQGPKSFELLQKVFPSLQDIEYYSIQEMESDSVLSFVARTGYTGEDGFEIFASHKRIQEVWQQLLDLGVVPCGLGARDVLRLEVCFPLYGNELDETVTPLDCGLKWTVKFDKANFIGKEALKEYSPQFQTIKLTLEKGIPRSEYEVVTENNTKLGFITSGTMSVMTGQGIAMARVGKGNFSDHDIFVNIRGKLYKANKVTKPFVTGGHK